MFEVTSSYGTVGLSLGTPRASSLTPTDLSLPKADLPHLLKRNTSLSGVLRTLSKLILIAVMIRGRHRGLPVAIDRSIILPSELDKFAPSTADSASTKLGRRTSRMSVRSAGGDSTRSGGLEAVPTETDQARVARTRQESAAREEEDHGFSFTNPMKRWRRASEEEKQVEMEQAEPDSSASSKEIVAAEEARRASGLAKEGEQQP